MDKYGNTIDYVRLNSDQDSDGGDGTEHDHVDHSVNDASHEVNHAMTTCDKDLDGKTCDAEDAVRNMVIDERTIDKHDIGLDCEHNIHKIETAGKKSENENKES